METQEIGTVLGSYQLVRNIGEGSMGCVYMARHLRLGRNVALKMLRPEHALNPDLLRRFFQEARAVNQINHEHIVEIFDFVDDAQVYYVMELLEGKPLSELMDTEALAIPRAVRLTRQLCSALDAAHRVGVIHRDVKPDNVFVASGDYVKVLDFGVAKLTRGLEGVNPGRTLEGLIIGTPDYMSPEQALGKTADERTDIYGTGALLYRLLAGRLPFEAESLAELLTQVVRTPPRSLPKTVPEGLATVVMRCLEKDPAERYGSMTALAAALQPFEEEAAGKRRLVLPSRRYIAAGAAGLIALGVWANRAGAEQAAAASAGAEWQVTLAEPPVIAPAPEDGTEKRKDAQRLGSSSAAALRTAASRPVAPPMRLMIVPASLQAPAPAAPTVASAKKSRVNKAHTARGPRSIDDVIDPFAD